MPFVVGNSLAHDGNIVGEGGILRAALIVDFLTAFCVCFDLGLERLQLTKVLILHLSVLDLDNV